MATSVADLDALTDAQLKAAYQKLWLELTIAARAVWSESRYSELEKLNGLKWINEIQHRVWGAHAGDRTRGQLLQLVDQHIQNAPHIGFHVWLAFERAIDSAQDHQSST